MGKNIGDGHKNDKCRFVNQTGIYALTANMNMSYIRARTMKFMINSIVDTINMGWTSFSCPLHALTMQ